MTRYRLDIEYDGRPFCGWQRQPDQPSVQEALERAVEALNGTPARVFGAGRTDTGVHARGQVAHVDLRVERAADKVANALNHHLRPNRVVITRAQQVSEDFNARFSATARHYRYTIFNRRAGLTMEHGLAWWVPQPLDAAAMHRAAQSLVGYHDFTTFRDAGCQANSPLRTLGAITVAREGVRVHVTCHAQSFLHRQVRSIVGCLVEVGRGRQSEDWVGDVLERADRAACGPVAPPDGLYLTRVDYPD